MTDCLHSNASGVRLVLMLIIAQINFRNPIAALPFTPLPNDDVHHSLCIRDGGPRGGADVLTVSGKIQTGRHCTHLAPPSWKVVIRATTYCHDQSEDVTTSLANTGDGGNFNTAITVSKLRDRSVPFELEVCSLATITKAHCIKKMLELDAIDVAKSSDDVVNYLADFELCLNTDVESLLDEGTQKRGWSNLPDFARRPTAQNRQHKNMA